MRHLQLSNVAVNCASFDLSAHTTRCPLKPRRPLVRVLNAIAIKVKEFMSAICDSPFNWLCVPQLPHVERFAPREKSLPLSLS